MLFVSAYIGASDQLLGFAFDGYPIYGPYDTSGNLLTSADLDECHGETLDDGGYRCEYLQMKATALVITSR